jgi:glucose/arabinose dehydrogenase
VQPAASLNLFASGFSLPVHITSSGDGSGRLFVTEQCGRILILKNNAVQSTPFLDINTKVTCAGEQGLLSVAFPPGYAEKGHFYVYYTDLNGNITISRYRLSNPDAADPATEEILLVILIRCSPITMAASLPSTDGYLYGGTGTAGAEAIQMAMPRTPHRFWQDSPY